MQSIKGDDTVGDVEFADQLLRGGDLVGLFLNIDMRQDNAGLSIECVQQLGRLAITEIVETTPQRLAVERDGASCWMGRLGRQSGGVAAEDLLNSLWIEALEDVANGGMSGRAFPVQPKGGVQLAAVDLDERLDGSKGVSAGHDGKN